MTSCDRLDAERDLDIAMAVASEINRVIAAADAKAGLLLATQGVVLAGLAANPGGGATPGGAQRIVAAVAVLLAGVSVALLVAALWPRTPGSSPWFAFSSLHLDVAMQERPASSRLANDAWAQAGTLADIARRKYSWFRAALLVGVAAVLTFMTWILMGRYM